jgi:DNA repair protein RadC
MSDLKVAEPLLLRELVVSYGDRGRVVGRKQVTTPETLSLMMSDMHDLVQEEFRIALLDGRHRCVGWHTASLGTATASLIHPREVFAFAVQQRAVSIVCIHNHPSGDPSPSKEDKEITKRLRECGDLLGIQMLDHIILAGGTYFSFHKEDMLNA